MTPTQREAAERLADDRLTATMEWSRQVIALLRELAEVPVSEPVAWLVMDESGYVQHAASWRDAAHEHSNDAINEHDLVCARTWRVVPVYAAPQQRTFTDERSWTLLLVGPENGIVGKHGETFVLSPQHYERITVYASPQQRKQLTDEQIDAIAQEELGFASLHEADTRRFARAVEKAHGITGEPT
jgi:hypothetical protein